MLDNPTFPRCTHGHAVLSVSLDHTQAEIDGACVSCAMVEMRAVVLPPEKALPEVLDRGGSKLQ